MTLTVSKFDGSVGSVNLVKVKTLNLSLIISWLTAGAGAQQTLAISSLSSSSDLSR